MVAKSVTAVEPGRTLMLAAQWLFSANKDRDAGTAELRRVERITCGLLHLDISSNGGDGDDADIWSTQGHNQRDGVIRGNIGVDQECARHSRSIANRVPEDFSG